MEVTDGQLSVSVFYNDSSKGVVRCAFALYQDNYHKSLKNLWGCIALPSEEYDFLVQR